MKALALDFDGVISDSLPEAFVVAVRTVREVMPECAFGPHAEQDAGLYARFLEIVPLGNRAEDFGVALMALHAEASLPDQAAYDAFYQTLDRTRLRAFHKRFYRVRHAWMQQDPEGWYARIQPYERICALLRRRAGDVRLAIATAKDRHSVRELVDRYGIGDLFPEGWIHDKETGVSKRAHIEAIARDVGCEAHEVTFIDDKVNHVIDVSAIGARGLLAGWGYNSEREHRVAREAGFAIPTLETLEAELFDGSPRA